MFDIEKALKECKEQREIVSHTKKKINDIEQQIADHSCPFSVGDLVENEEGLKAVISSISFCSWNRSRYDFKIKKIKKDGAPSKLSNHAYSSENWKPIN